MLLRLLYIMFRAALFFGVIGIAIVTYVIFHYTRDLPDYTQLKNYFPPSITRIYSADGKLIEQYARENRVFVPINNMPKSLIEAFIAAEDKNFYEHSGIDLTGIFRAVLSNVSNILKRKRGLQGASTITQQVVKTFLLSSERSFDRKIKEAILSYMVSQIFTKEEILELYLNQIYLGKGAYGVAAAAQVYFNKSVKELTLTEAAILASLPKAPGRFNPERDYDRAFNRKNYVISRMYADNYISENDARKSMKEPIELKKMDKLQTINADYYATKVREEVIGIFGEEYFYTAGLTIITCVDSKMQEAAREALQRGILAYDKKRGYRGVFNKIENLENWQEELGKFKKPISARMYELAVVLEVDKTVAKIGLKDGSTSNIYLAGTKWAAWNLQSMRKILSKNDIIFVEKSAKNHRLAQVPEANGGIMVIEHSTGRVLASEGGYDYKTSVFDRTTQAKRQPGSLIKPFVYTAALESGANPNDIFVDEPIEIFQGSNLPMWSPRNFEKNFLGPMTLRQGLEKSRNIITVQVGQYAGTQKVVEVIKRFGINSSPPLYHSITLGAMETTLNKMTVAYSIIANRGHKVQPHYIELIKDRNGKAVYKRDYTRCKGCNVGPYDSLNNSPPPEIRLPEGKIIVGDDVNYQITSLLVGAAQRGTSQRTKSIGKIIAAKTGTTNDAKDAWFMGFTPKITVGTYIGYDNPKSLGKNTSGAAIALPIFVDFMKNGYDDYPNIDFIVPDSVTLLSVDYNTGLPSTGKNSIIEAFKSSAYNPMIENLKRKASPNGLFKKDESSEVY